MRGSHTLITADRRLHARSGIEIWDEVRVSAPEPTFLSLPSRLADAHSTAIPDPALTGKGFSNMADSILEKISSEFSLSAEKVGSRVVAVYARRWMPTSGIEWKE